MESKTAAELLKSYIERIERLEQDKADISEDIKEVYSSAKSSGLDPKIMRQIVKLRKMDASDRQEQAYMLEMYASAVGLEGLSLFTQDTVAKAGLSVVK